MVISRSIIALLTFHNKRFVNVLIIVLVLFSLSTVAESINAATYTVTKTNDTNDGMCNADCSLREAIAAANSLIGDDTINFASGLTGQTIMLSPEFGSLTITTNIIINTQAVLDITVSGGGGVRVFEIESNSNVEMRGFRITDGYAVNEGGGIKNSGNNLTLNNMVIQSNISDGIGGGIFTTNNLTINNSSIIDNTSSAHGGGIYTDTAATLNITDSTISNNSSTRLWGGGIYADTSTTVMLSNVTISNNMSDNNGAGGGMIVYEGISTITNSNIINNESSSGGGISLTRGGPHHITNTTFTENSATPDAAPGSDGSGGGGLNAEGTEVYITNSTFSGNLSTSSRGGGGISLTNSSTCHLTNVTIARNNALNGTGGGINGQFFGSPATINIVNTIISDNIAVGTNKDINGTINSQGYNLVHTRGTSTGYIATDLPDGTDPMLGTLKNNGGSNKTLDLENGSPAIDAANPNNYPSTDQRGFNRPFDGDADGKAEPDIGALEDNCSFSLSINSTTATVNGGNGTVDVTTFSGCSWTAVSNDSWITVTSGANGNGNGTVSFTIAPNTGAERIGTIAIAGKVLTVNQAACLFSLDPTDTNIPSTGGNGSFSVIASNSSCNWIGMTNSNWITITSATGTGNGSVDFSVAANSGNSPRSGTITIANQVFTVNQNFSPTISINDVSVQEGNKGTSNFDFTVNLSASNTKSISVDYATADGTAKNGEDYTAVNGTLTFAPSETSKTVTVQVNGDSLIEPNETFIVNLTNPVNATISDNQATGTIQNDDVGGAMEFSAANYTVDENVGTATITVNRSGGAASGVSVDYATSNGTATAKQDYTSSSGTITFGANETSKTFTVPIINDSIDESSETINLTLSNLSGGTIGSQNSATITINDNDESAISVNDALINEGNSGTSTLNFTVSLSNESVFPIMVDYLTNNGTATAGKDYTTANGTLTFAAGETSKTIGVEISGDTTVEPNENFTVILSNPSNATIADSQGTGTIQNDDTGGTVQFSTANFSVNENGGTTSVTVTRTGGTASDVSVNYLTSNGTATSGKDYTPTAGTLTFGANETSKSFNVSITNDSQGENNETIDLTLINPMGGGTLGTPSAAVLTIIDDDQCTYTLSPTNVNVDSSGVTNATFSVTTQAGCNWSASTNNSWISIPSSNNGTGNGNVNYSVLENTGIARTGTIFVANQTFTINQASGVVSAPNIFDFDGDRKTDISVFRPSLGEWWYLRSSDLGSRALPFGSASDIPTPADFTGDGKADISFFRNGEWFVLRSEDDSFFSFPWGTNGDVPAPGDYDGDNKADPTVFRPNDQTWFILKSTGGADIIPFGIAEDKPVIADYDGDGKDDIAIYRPSNGQWWINQSTDGVTALQFGSSGDKTVQGDYTGDGKADIAFFRPNTGEWFIIRSEDSSFFSFPFGAAGDIAAPGDYDGDGTFDVTVFRPTNTTWFINGTQSGVQILGFGLSDDIPVPSVYSVP